MGNQYTYQCYLNGKFYGSGNLQYMRELFVDYVVNCKMYGKSEVEFKIIKKEDTRGSSRSKLSNI